MDQIAADNDADNNIRAEYSELSRNFTEVIKYRFTILALFVAGQGALLSNSDKHSKYVFIFAMIVTVGIWLIELRTRGIYNQLQRRAEIIEGYWDKRNSVTAKRVFSSLLSRSGSLGSVTLFGYPLVKYRKAMLDVFPTSGKHLERIELVVKNVISHSFGIDLVFAALFLADAVMLLL